MIILNIQIIFVNIIFILSFIKSDTRIFIKKKEYFRALLIKLINNGGIELHFMDLKNYHLKMLILETIAISLKTDYSNKSANQILKKKYGEPVKRTQ